MGTLSLFAKTSVFSSFFRVLNEWAYDRFKYAFYMPYKWVKDGISMPKGEVKILKANGEVIILETNIGVDYRFSIPKAIRSLIDPKEKVQITIKKVEEVNI